MSEKENNNKTSGITDSAITVGTVIGAFIFGQFFGLLGVGAVAIGWFAFNKTKEELGRFIAVCAGVVAGLAAYGLALIVIAILIV